MTLLARLREGGDKLLDNTLPLNASKVGFHLRQAGWSANDTWVWMRDKVCIVTGANSGLGKAVSTRQPLKRVPSLPWKLTPAERAKIVSAYCNGQMVDNTCDGG
jgi:hypothetical protein